MKPLNECRGVDARCLFRGFSIYTTMVNRENYVVLQGFMITELKLKGNELIAYALIHGYSQGEQGIFTGSQSYIASWLNCSRATTNKVLKSLVDKGLLRKTDTVKNGITFCNYETLHPVKKVYTPPVKKLDKPCQKSLHHNIVNNIEEYKYSIEREILNQVASLFDSKYYDTKSKKQKWLDAIRLLIQQDKEKPSDIVEVIKYARNDEFWQSNLLSIAGIRKKNGDGISKYDSIKARYLSNNGTHQSAFKNFD